MKAERRRAESTGVSPTAAIAIVPTGFALAWAAQPEGVDFRQRLVFSRLPLACAAAIIPLVWGNGKSLHMTDVTQILKAIEEGDPKAAEQLLPLVYDELRKLAAAKMAQEKPGQTLQATALVHEAYLRLVDNEKPRHWNSRGHFFGAAAEAMRRILVERARHKQCVKQGGEQHRVGLPVQDLVADDRVDEILHVSEALDALAEADPEAAELVKLRFFAGLTLAEAAAALGIPRRSVDRIWVYAKAWLGAELRE